jgi:hypothetical protein
VARARRRAEEARDRVTGTIDEILDYAHDLQARLAPSHIARDAWEAAKEKGVDLAEDAVDAVRTRPVAATGAVAALALFIAREPLMELAGRLMKRKRKGEPKAKAKPNRKDKLEKTDA